MSDLSIEPAEAEEVQPDVTYIARAFAFGLGTADFRDEDGAEGTEPVVLFDTVLVEAGTDHTVNARIVLAGATSALVAEEAEAAAVGLLGLILAEAGIKDESTFIESPEGEEGEVSA